MDMDEFVVDMGAEEEHDTACVGVGVKGSVGDRHQLLLFVTAAPACALHLYIYCGACMDVATASSVTSPPFLL